MSGCRGRRSDPSWRHRGWQRQLSQSSLIAYRHTWLKIIAWGGGGRPRPRNLPGRKDWGSSMRKRPADEGVAFISRSKLRSPPLSRPRVTLPSVMRQSSPARRPSCATRPLRNWLAAPRTAPRIKGGDDCKRSATPTVIGVRGSLLASRQPAARPSASRQ